MVSYRSYIKGSTVAVFLSMGVLHSSPSLGNDVVQVAHNITVTDSAGRVVAQGNTDALLPLHEATEAAESRGEPVEYACKLFAATKTKGYLAAVSDTTDRMGHVTTDLTPGQVDSGVHLDTCGGKVTANRYAVSFPMQVRDDEFTIVDAGRALQHIGLPQGTTINKRQDPVIIAVGGTNVWRRTFPDGLTVTDTMRASLVPSLHSEQMSF